MKIALELKESDPGSTGIVGDLFTVVPQLIEAVTVRKG